jgi:hypothetical protein
MINYFKFFIFITILIFATCAQQDTRKMWEPSRAYIGIEPNDDAPVRAGINANMNYAQDKTLTIEHSVSMAYLKFFMPGFSKIDSAILYMQTKSVQSAGEISVYEVPENNWDETKITWSERPDIGTKKLVSLVCDEKSKVYEFDLTNHVKQKTNAGDFYICLCFKADKKGTSLSFASVEDYQNLKPRFMLAGLTYVPDAPPDYAPVKFNHPGILTTQDQIDFVREKIAAGQSPWKEAFGKAAKSDMVQPGYKPSPIGKLTSTGFYSRRIIVGYKELARDSKAVFANAQLWAVTDCTAYADKAIEIINAWAETNKEITGGNDKLTAGSSCIQFTNAAEIIKHTYSGWKVQQQETFENWLRNVIWPLLKDFIPSYNGNWDAVIGQGLISMGIFLDDKFIFDHAVNYYLNGIGNGTMSYYVRNDSTTQETLRDQGHEQMGVGALAGFAEIAWNQGVDLYSKKNSRLLKGIEGTAKRVNEVDCQILEIWESMYNHYHNRLGFEMPYTEAILNKPGYRPEGYGNFRGFNTLFFYGLGNE